MAKITIEVPDIVEQCEDCKCFPQIYAPVLGYRYKCGGFKLFDSIEIVSDTQEPMVCGSCIERHDYDKHSECCHTDIEREDGDSRVIECITVTPEWCPKADTQEPNREKDNDNNL